jgi:hypothetical protein
VDRIAALLVANRDGLDGIWRPALQQHNGREEDRQLQADLVSNESPDQCPNGL